MTVQSMNAEKHLHPLSAHIRSLSRKHLDCAPYGAAEMQTKPACMQVTVSLWQAHIVGAVVHSCTVAWCKHLPNGGTSTAQQFQPKS